MKETLAICLSVMVALASIIASVVAMNASIKRAQRRSVEEEDRQRLEEALLILRGVEHKPQGVQTAINKLDRQLHRKEKVSL